MSLLKTIKHEGHKGTRRKPFNLLTFVYSPALACGASVVPFVFEKSHK